MSAIATSNRYGPIAPPADPAEGAAPYLAAALGGKPASDDDAPAPLPGWADQLATSAADASNGNPGIKVSILQGMKRCDTRVYGVANAAEQRAEKKAEKKAAKAAKAAGADVPAIPLGDEVVDEAAVKQKAIKTLSRHAATFMGHNLQTLEGLFMKNQESPFGHKTLQAYFKAFGLDQRSSQDILIAFGMLFGDLYKSPVGTNEGFTDLLRGAVQKVLPKASDMEVEEWDKEVQQWVDVMVNELHEAKIFNFVNTGKLTPVTFVWAPLLKFFVIQMTKRNESGIAFTKEHWPADPKIRKVLDDMVSVDPSTAKKASKSNGKGKGKGKRAHSEVAQEAGEGGESSEPPVKKGVVRTRKWLKEQIIEATGQVPVDYVLVAALQAELKKKNAEVVKSAAKRAAAAAVQAPVDPADVMDLTNDENDGKTAEERNQEIREKHTAEMAENAAASAPQGPVQVVATLADPADAVTAGAVPAPPPVPNQEPIVNEEQEQNEVQVVGKKQVVSKKAAGLRITRAPKDKGQPAPKAVKEAEKMTKAEEKKAKAAATKARRDAAKEAKEAEKKAKPEEAKKAKEAEKAEKAKKVEENAARVAAAARAHAQAEYSSDSSSSDSD